MLKGLEISEVRFLYAKDFVDFRIDYDTYSKTALYYESKLKSKNLKKIGDLCSDVQNFGAYSLCNFIEYISSGIPYLQTQNISENIINYHNTPFISEEVHEILWKSHCVKGQVLLTMAGAYLGKAAVYDKDFISSSNQAIAKITLNPKTINPYYLAAFINTEFGQFQIQRLKTVTGQPNINMSLIRHINIVVLSKVLQDKIEEIAKKAQFVYDNTFTYLESLKENLLKALNLYKWQPTEENTTVKKFSESFGNSGRLDAEFYQPYFDEVETILKSNGFALLEDICSEINYGTVPTSPYTEDGTGIPYIKGTNFKNTLIDSEGLDRIVNTDDLPEKYFTKEGDIIISQMGTVGDTGVVEKHQVGWLFASFTIRVRIKDKKNFDPHFVAFYIQHIAKPYYLHRYIAQASVRQNTDLPTIKNLYVPKVPIETQKEIAKQIKKSFKLKQDSSHLIEIAKQAVEIAIEKDEATALNFIKEKEAEIK